MTATESLRKRCLLMAERKKLSLGVFGKDSRSLEEKRPGPL
jgi:hypothetical protein